MLPLRKVLKARERQYICALLRVYAWDKPRTAKVLGIGLSTLYRKIATLGIKKGQVFTK